MLFNRPLFLAIGLIALASTAIAQELPTRKKAPPASKLDAELERFRAAPAEERLKLIEKLAGDKQPFAAVARGDLVTAVVERGVIEPAIFSELICKVKARKEGTAAATIKWVIDDGAMVKKGDALVLLDTSALTDELQAAKEKMEAAKAELNKATDNIKVVVHENEIEVRLAEIALKLREIDLKNPPDGKQKEVLELKVEAAKLLLEKAKSLSKTKLANAEADKRARITALEAELQQYRMIEGELKLCDIRAPMDGLAVYYVPENSRFGSSAGLVEVGASVREGQKILKVCELKKFLVSTRVREELISTVRSGHPAQVKVDAFPARAFKGKVTQIATVASKSDWRGADIKVYPVTIAIEDEYDGLKPSMSAEIHIATGERKDVLQVPLQATMTVGRERFCFIKKGQAILERKVLTGASNATTIEIREGLEEGDLVIANLPSLLVRP